MKHKIQWGTVITGVYLILPGGEDAGTGGLTLIPSMILGSAMVAYGMGWLK